MIAEGIAIKTSLSGATTLISKASNKLKNFFTEYYQPYMEKTVSEYSKIRHRLTRVRETVNFYDVYVETFLSKNNLKILPRNLVELFKDSKNILVIGNAGSGKTTLVKHLFMQSIEQGFAIPLVITLRKFNRNPISIQEFIKNELTEILAYPDKEKVESFLQEGSFLILFDGFDELYAENFEKVHDDLNNFCKKYKDNYFLMTSRPLSSHLAFSTNFSFYNVADLTFKQMKEFIKKNELDEEFSNQMINTLESFESSKHFIKDFLKNPLLLLMYMMTYRSEPKIPDRKTKFYDNVIRELFENHDIHTKMGYDRKFKSKLSKEQIRKILERFSLLSFFDGRYEFDRTYLDDKFDSIKAKLGVIFDNTSFIDDIVTALSLFQVDGASFSFIHKSIQEYFVADYMSSIDDDTTKEKVYTKCLQILEDIVYDTQHFRELLEELDEYSYLKFIQNPLFKKYKKDVLFSSKDMDKIIEHLLNEFVYFGETHSFSWYGNYNILKLINISVSTEIGMIIVNHLDYKNLIIDSSNDDYKVFLTKDNKELIFEQIKGVEELQSYILYIKDEFSKKMKKCTHKLVEYEKQKKGEQDLIELI